MKEACHGILVKRHGSTRGSLTRATASRLSRPLCKSGNIYSVPVSIYPMIDLVCTSATAAAGPTTLNSRPFHRCRALGIRDIARYSLQECVRWHSEYSEHRFLSLVPLSTLPNSRTR
ncbi:hypothetical protein QE152_g15824 [Popillia japonica]|uniref:Uncharacterized protein n=1 Tax=Popillia japonica TaxID=7064 RepID=A0AAW1L6H8_POPJA